MREVGMGYNAYREIMEAVRPELPSGHPRMDVLNRAKIFAPFAALRGFEERISVEEKRSRDETQGCPIDEYDA